MLPLFYNMDPPLQHFQRFHALSSITDDCSGYQYAL